MKVLTIGIYTAIAGMTIKSLTGDTNGLLLCGFSLIALLLLNQKPILRQRNEEHQIEKDTEEK